MGSAGTEARIESRPVFAAVAINFSPAASGAFGADATRAKSLAAATTTVAIIIINDDENGNNDNKNKKINRQLQQK